jgi:hypothetical protein
MRMKLPKVLLTLSLFLCLFAPSLHAAMGSDKPTAVQVPFTVDDFDWREMVPYLFAAAALPGEEGIKTVLENSNVLRSYVAKEVRAECRPGNDRCDSSSPGFTLNGEVTKRIDGIVREGIIHRNKSSFVDFTLDDQSFPFSEIGAIRSDNRRDAYFILQLAAHSYTADQMQAKYGAPYDTDIVQWYSIFKYRVDNANYTSKAVFEVNPANGEVLKVAISLKTKKHH